MKIEFRETQKHLDHLQKMRMEMIEHFRVPMRFLRVKKKATGRLGIKPK